MHDESIKTKAGPKDDYKISRLLPCCALRKKNPLSSEQFEMAERYAMVFEDLFCHILMLYLFQFLAKAIMMPELIRKGNPPEIAAYLL